MPDYSTVWRFREALAETGAIEPLFARFDAELKEQGYPAMNALGFTPTKRMESRRRLLRQLQFPEVSNLMYVDLASGPWMPPIAAR